MKYDRLYDIAHTAIKHGSHRGWFKEDGLARRMALAAVDINPGALGNEPIIDAMVGVMEANKLPWQGHDPCDEFSIEKVEKHAPLFHQ